MSQAVARTLLSYPEKLAVVRFGPGSDVPAWAESSSVFSVTATAVETSVVCAARNVPGKARSSGPYTAFVVQGQLDPSEVGVLHALLGPLVEAGVPMMAMSTFDTDWILVPTDQAADAAEAWQAAGHTVAAAPVIAGPPEPSPEPRKKKKEMSVTHPGGFSASGIAAGLKSTGARDLALVVNSGPRYDAASVFTSNRCKANPILWSERVVADGTVRAIALNSGGANCYTGPDGFVTTHSVAEQVAGHLGIGAIDVVVCSTGLIGLANPREQMLAGVDAAYAALSETGGSEAAEAIMTTDSVSKQVVVEGAGWSIGGMAKGAGMLAPQLATMLVVLTTDAVVEAAELDAALRAATRVSFDRLDSDGCMSTNDTVAVMASGASGITPSTDDFTAALTQACSDLAMQLLKDAEGADHEIAITVLGAASEDDAVEVGRSVARSNLFKAAIFGQDPNWGRVLASIGTTQAAFDPSDLDVAMNGVWVCRESTPAEDPASVDLSGREVSVTIDLKAGPERATVWTNDLTHAYVHENSAYS